MSVYSFEAVATVSSPYTSKFAIPRQPGLVPEAKGRVILASAYNQEAFLRGLEQISHLWLTFVFHVHLGATVKPMVRPPRLGGNDKIGVFASRGTYRPNPIGLSVVALDGVSCEEGQWQLHISGMDLLDGTPVLDIKPYLPYADIIPNAVAGYASDAPPVVPVSFAQSAQEQLEAIAQRAEASEAERTLGGLICSVLRQDPRPAYKRGKDEGAEYGMTLYHWNIRWRVSEGAFEVFDVRPLAELL